MSGREPARHSRRSRSRSLEDRYRPHSSSHHNPLNAIGRPQHSKSRPQEKYSHRHSRDDDRRRDGSGNREFHRDRDWERRDSGQYRNKRKHRDSHGSSGASKHGIKGEFRVPWKHRISEDERRDSASHRDSVARDQSPSRVKVKREDSPPTSSIRSPLQLAQTPPPSQGSDREPGRLIPKAEVPEEALGTKDAEAIWARQKIDTERRTSAGGTEKRLGRSKEGLQDVPMVCDAERALHELPKAGVNRSPAHDEEREPWESQKAAMEDRLKMHEAERAKWEQEKVSTACKIKTLQDELSKRDAAIQSLEKRNEDMGMTMFKWEGKLREEKDKLREAEARDLRWKSEVDLLQDRLRKVERELAQTKTLLEARTEENKVAQAFMTTADHYSIADVSHTVDLLNNEIFQCAMDMSDALLQCREADAVHTPAEDETWRLNLEKACREAADIWTEPLVTQLREGVEKGETILFDCLIQSVFVARCRQVIQCFCPENSEVDEYMDGMWARILHSNEMPISKKWLAITNKALGRRSFVEESVLPRLGYLLTIAGWRSTPSDASTLQIMIQTKLTDIIEKAVKVREMISEGVLSANVEVFSFGMNERYDPLQMQDAYEAPGRSIAGGCSDKEPIVCTTALGLRCTVAGAGMESGRWKREVIMKAKVVMQSTLTLSV